CSSPPTHVHVLTLVHVPLPSHTSVITRRIGFASPLPGPPTSTPPRAVFSSGGKGGQAMATVRYRALRAPACIALLALAACARQGEGEMSWARSALERNAAFEVVAADEQSRTFTVRMKDTGERRLLRA